MFSEDELKAMEKYAAEMKVVKFTFNVLDNTDVCDAMSTGLGRSKVLEQVTLYAKGEETVRQIKAVSHKTVTLHVE